MSSGSAGASVLPTEEQKERFKEAVLKHRGDLRKLEQILCGAPRAEPITDVEVEEFSNDLFDPYTAPVPSWTRNPALSSAAQFAVLRGR